MNQYTSSGRQSGFTLVEVIVSLSIFSVISFIGLQVLISANSSSNRLQESSDRLFSLQSSMWIISSDLNQIVGRSILDEYGEVQPALTSLVPGEVLSFTTSKFNSTLIGDGVSLQRVSYVMEDYNGANSFKTALYRYIWPVLDRTTNTEPVKQLLLSDIEYVEFSFIGDGGDFHTHWPSNADIDRSSQRDVDIDANPLPKAVMMTVAILEIGKIERWFALNSL